MPATRLPKHRDLDWPTVQALRALGGSGTTSEIEEKVIERQGFDEALQTILHNDGPMTETGYRLHWARTTWPVTNTVRNTCHGSRN